MSPPVPSAAWVASLRLQRVKKFNFRIIRIVGDVVTKLGSEITSVSLQLTMFTICDGSTYLRDAENRANVSNSSL